MDIHKNDVITVFIKKHVLIYFTKSGDIDSCFLYVQVQILQQLLIIAKLQL